MDESRMRQLMDEIDRDMKLSPQSLTAGMDSFNAERMIDGLMREPDAEPAPRELLVSMSLPCYIAMQSELERLRAEARERAKEKNETAFARIRADMWQIACGILAAITAAGMVVALSIFTGGWRP